jgi:nitroreductase
MEVSRAISGRRAVRDYLDKQVPEEVIAKILKAGAMAPSAMDRQPCRYIVITGKEKRTELSEKVKSKMGDMLKSPRIAERLKVRQDIIFYDAPLVIFIVAEKGDYTIVDCSLAAQNMMLQAYDLGLGSCYIGFAGMLRSDRELLRSLGVEDGQELYAQLIFGYPKEWPAPKDREPKIQKRIS